jgi:hypothetical protein
MVMDQEEFDKLYFKAKLAGQDAVGKFVLQLMKSRDIQFVIQVIQLYSEGHEGSVTDDSLSGDRLCEKSPYALCFCTPFTVDKHKLKPTDMYCIWCAKIYMPDLTDPNITWVHNGAYIIDGINF